MAACSDVEAAVRPRRFTQKVLIVLKKHLFSLADYIMDLCKLVLLICAVSYLNKLEVKLVLCSCLLTCRPCFISANLTPPPQDEGMNW